ncbi:exonuclease subunit SbcC [Aquifex aeolicus]|uniref:Probable DNA double-strand break repair Rad50 ATPase n=1 Tax=Aquifex aeolicus (strain VF5) TaxID=224324 RepID=RAD50_AQUAE|nr:exonuclease subunit SbcC [Aquifex aeolicus]O67124.1 RecName: Full=Probable DNA double-strand break repair Rad50 ATPase [Aquifex aeolicus VF5]AAC07092.1 hypothetical protein aq_1006 [Aquifex aeolicus VF5]
MRPLKLEVKGFTVYKKPQVIDFTPLKFFVIQGKTGAGKTSIIDAITYALYGKVPRYGASVATKYVLSRGEKELKVALDFSLRGRNYRVERYYREFPEDSQVRVYEEGRRLNIKANEVEKWLFKISGLDYKTFTKVILLPQGEFDRFLKESSERKKILINLLGLEELEKVRQLASETFKNLEGKREALKKEYELLKDYTPTKKEVLEKTLKNLEEELKELKETEEKLRQELKKAEEKDSLERELSQVVTKLKELENLEKEVEKLREKLEFSRKVAPYVPIAKRIEEIDKKLTELKVRKNKLTKELAVLKDELSFAQEELNRIEAEKEKFKEEKEREKELEHRLKKLQEIKEILKELSQLSSSLKEKEREYEQAKQEFEDLSERVEKGKKLVAETEEKLEKIKELFSEEEYTSLKMKERLLVELQRKLKELKEKEGQLENLTQKYKEKKKVHEKVLNELKELERELKERELHYHAHMVASYLSPGDTCPVCGGIYRGKALENVDAEGISELKHAKELKEKEEREIDTTLKLYAQKINSLKEEMEKLRNEVEELRKEIPENLKERIKKLEELRIEKEKLEHKLNKYRKALEDRQKQKEEAQAKLHKAQTELELLKEKIREKSRLVKEFKELYRVERLEDYEESLKEEINYINSKLQEIEEKEKKLRKHFEELSSRKSKLEGELSALNESINSLEEERKEKLKELANIYEVAKSPREVVELYLGDKEAELERKIKEFEESFQSLKLKKSEIEEKLKEYEGIRELSDIKGEYESVKTQLEEKHKKLGEVKRELEHLGERLKRKEELQKEISELEKKLEVYRVISNDFRGDRFQKYVSEIMLQKVVDRASEYFYKFTGNYFFELERATKGRDKDIVVVESSTSQRRPVSSLSGGETFLASLSFAFAVSDLLSGSANLESLFIDEGFGSLDQDMRERVSEILEAIKTNVNKMIGIVSHIPDFAERFTERIVVEKKGDYSEVRVIY